MNSIQLTRTGYETFKGNNEGAPAMNRSKWEPEFAVVGVLLLPPLAQATSRSTNQRFID